MDFSKDSNGKREELFADQSVGRSQQRNNFRDKIFYDSVIEKRDRQLLYISKRCELVLRKM
jgi:hypothetical protein